MVFNELQWTGIPFFLLSRKTYFCIEVHWTLVWKCRTRPFVVCCYCCCSYRLMWLSSTRWNNQWQHAKKRSRGSIMNAFHFQLPLHAGAGALNFANCLYYVISDVLQPTQALHVFVLSHSVTNRVSTRKACLWFLVALSCTLLNDRPNSSTCRSLPWRGTSDALFC